ncbi:hypothetical protein BDF14DRAFT_1847660 [Spinellus fusiger]|nr:hypothetical protein BDF14DRAFT_1847660 [Spinellus fusiger]
MDLPCCRRESLAMDQLCQSACQLVSPDTAAITQASMLQRQAVSRMKEAEGACSHSPTQRDGGPESEQVIVKTEPTLPLVAVRAAEHRERVLLRDIYHTLEYDQGAMVEQKKLQECQAQEEMNEEEEKENPEDTSLAIFNTNGNFNLKYLLQGIAANRLQTSLSDRELQNLLSDFRPHRSKWANDERPGQEELYEACEKVLNDLKNYTEHSTPFLNKVSKREAPDYFDVIKRPMDLGTVAKKLKLLNYKSKKEFSDDLYLIYENCLIYNTNPASEYRKHAIAMRRKTDRLMGRVPDISISERPEAEIDDDMEEASEEETEVQRVFRKAPGSHSSSTASKQRGSSAPNYNNGTVRSSRERSLTQGSNTALQNITEIDSHTVAVEETNGQPASAHTESHKSYGGKQLKNQHGDKMDIDLEQGDKELNDELDDDVGELQDQLWRDMTKKTRAKVTADTEKQYQYAFGEREAIVRSPFDMGRFAILEHTHNTPQSDQKLARCTADVFSRWTERRRASASLYDDFDASLSDEDNFDAFFTRKITKPKTEENDAARNDLFLPEYIISSGLPEIQRIPQELKEEPSQDVSLEAYSSTAFPNHGLNAMMDQNLNEMQHIRMTYAKCNSVRNNVPISTLASSISLDSSHSVAPSVYSSITKPNHLGSATTPHSFASPSFSSAPSNVQKPLPPLIMNQESSQLLAQRTIVKLLAHAGFEGAHTGALNIFTDMMTDYMLNIGKTLRSYWDDYGRQMNSEEIIMHTLYENGVPSISALESYIVDDIGRLGSRLEDLHRKLDTSYQDIISGSTDKLEHDTEALLQDEETFMTGSFGEDFGDDYFGFKELGLDKEFNLSAYSIPSRLWYGKDQDKGKSINVTSNEPLPKYLPPPPFTPVASEKELIGLLQHVFRKKLNDAPRALIEDEYIPSRNRNRSRYPPTNKNSVMGRKKTAKDGSFSGGGAGNGGDNKKSKRKRPLEEIKAERAERAEKKRQKLEERAQRMAEKEQKRKIREELKEQERQAKLEAKEKKVRTLNNVMVALCLMLRCLSQLQKR